jgi:hypothetical protein
MTNVKSKLHRETDEIQWDQKFQAYISVTVCSRRALSIALLGHWECMDRESSKILVIFKWILSTLFLNKSSVLKGFLFDGQMAGRRKDGLNVRSTRNWTTFNKSRGEINSETGDTKSKEWKGEERKEIHWPCTDYWSVTICRSRIVRTSIRRLMFV